MSKNALVINGGGSRGAFAVGAIKKIFETTPELQFDIMVGTGTGALIAPFAALGQLSPLIEIFTTKHDRDIIKKYPLSERLREPSFLDVSPFWGLLDHYYTHPVYDQLRHGRTEIYFNTVCLQTRELTVFSNRINPDIAARYAHRSFDSYDQFLRTLLASFCQPVLLPPVAIHPGEEPVRQYIDAGLREYAGIEMAIARGATDVYVLLSSPETPARHDREYKDLFTILQGALDIFVDAAGNNEPILPRVYNEGLQYIETVKSRMRQAGVAESKISDWFDEEDSRHNPFHGRRPVRLHIVRPDKPLGGGPDGLSFHPEAMQEMMAKGEQTMENYLRKLMIEG